MSLVESVLKRPTGSNLLAWVLLLTGLYSATSLTREFFPESSPESASVTAIWPGAAPEDLEEGVVRRVEDALIELDEVDRVTASVLEETATIMVEFRESVSDVDKAVDEVQRAVDAIPDIPAEVERLTVTEFEPVLPVIMLNAFGEADEIVRKRVLKDIERDLRGMPGMGRLVLTGIRDDEISVEFDPLASVQVGRSLPEIAGQIGAAMDDGPAGTVLGADRITTFRGVGREESVEAISDIRISGPGGSWPLSDLASVDATFDDTPIRSRYAGVAGSGATGTITVYKTGDQDAVDIARMVRAYAAGRRDAADRDQPRLTWGWFERFAASLYASSDGKTDLRSDAQKAYETGYTAPGVLPDQIDLSISSDLARFIEGRIDLLARNAAMGGVLVFVLLLVALSWRTAWWVFVGLSLALCGTLTFMALTGTTLNLLTMFGLIIVIGLLVDDAIVVSENIESYGEAGHDPETAAILGTKQVFWPVTATIATSIVAFLPLSFIRGQIGDLMGALPAVVACALITSLVESLLILPIHMKHSLAARPKRVKRGWSAFRDNRLLPTLQDGHAWLLRRALRRPALTVSIAISTSIFCLGLVAAGKPPFEFLPTSDSETVIAELRMPVGTPVSETEKIVQRIESAARAMSEVKGVSGLSGAQASVDDTSGMTLAGTGSHLGQVFIELLPVESRVRESKTVTADIRDRIGPVPQAERLVFTEIQGGPAGRAITIEVASEDDTRRQAAVDALKAVLAGVDGVVDIGDDDPGERRELRVEARPSSVTLGLSESSIGEQVRTGLLGSVAHRFALDGEEVDLRVRLDTQTRRSTAAMEQSWILSASGIPVPLAEVASLREATAPASIRRVDRRRTTSVVADCRPDLSPETAMQAIRPGLERVQSDFPGVIIDEGGRQRQLSRAFASLPIGFLAATIGIYMILCLLFASMRQPMAVLASIPFGIIGVVLGHVLTGYNLTFLSLVGFIALSGIVVNDSLVLVEFFNRKKAEGVETIEALVAAGRRRLRPILLTTLTTVLGLLPLMLEQSFQAKFLIPMAISISFGLISATVLILVVLPALLLLFDNSRPELSTD